MKKLILVFFIISGLILNAQNSDYKHIIGLGVGSSSFGYFTNVGIKDGNNFVKKAYATPVFDISYNFMINKRFGFGAAVGYQNLYFDLLALDTLSSAVIMNINRTNLSIFGNFYFINNKNFALYSGLHLGATFWSGNISFQQLYDYLLRIIPPIVPESYSTKMISKVIPSKIKFANTFFAGQINLGSNIYFSNNIGIKMEFAIGAPYWGLLGLNIRL